MFQGLEADTLGLSCQFRPLPRDDCLPPLPGELYCEARPPSWWLPLELLVLVSPAEALPVTGQPCQSV